MAAESETQKTNKRADGRLAFVMGSMRWGAPLSDVSGGLLFKTGGCPRCLFDEFPMATRSGARTARVVRVDFPVHRGLSVVFAFPVFVSLGAAAL